METGFQLAGLGGAEMARVLGEEQMDFVGWSRGDMDWIWREARDVRVE
jgi:hypothetical protein